MNEKRYLPEGMRLRSAENITLTSGIDGLLRAAAQNKIVEGIAVRCDCSSMRLEINFGSITGYIERDEAVYMHNGENVKDIAIITRVGKAVVCKVLSVETTGGVPYVRLSRKAVQEECMQNYLLKKNAGDIIPARITHMEPFGAFADIGCGIISLLSIDCISVSRISHPSDRFRVGDRIMAVVHHIDRVSGRINLTHKELLGTWMENVVSFMPTQTVPGIIRSVEPYGAFVELAPNLTGLAELKNGLEPGMTCTAYIKNIIPERMKIKLAVVDTYTELSPVPMKYYVDTNTISHIDLWRYSPPTCAKQITTVFAEDNVH